MKLIKEDAQLDGTAEGGDSIHVEIQDELGVPGSSKLYVHVNGRTILRICKIRSGKNGFYVTDERRKAQP
jgi:hypothetical protein